MNWKEALLTTRGQRALAFCFLTLSMMFLFMPSFYNEIITPKKGLLLDDFVLTLFEPKDWSIPIFTILYLSVIHTLITSGNKPDVVIPGLTIYCVVNLLRTLSMYLLTLEPPAGMILLRDPISSVLYPDTGFAKDLFFSGHISSIMVLVVIEKNRMARIFKILGTTIMAVLLAWQHVHYTLDLVVAPLVTYMVFVVIQRWIDLSPPGIKSN